MQAKLTKKTCGNSFLGYFNKYINKENCIIKIFIFTKLKLKLKIMIIIAFIRIANAYNYNIRKFPSYLRS
jgi:hypothetical protein